MNLMDRIASAIEVSILEAVEDATSELSRTVENLEAQVRDLDARLDSVESQVESL